MSRRFLQHVGRGACVGLALAVGAPAAFAAPSPAQPAVLAVHTPLGLPRCRAAFVPRAALPSGLGEALRYQVEVAGVAVGTLDFSIARKGRHGGQPVREYRSLLTVDALVAALLPGTGRAASLVTQPHDTPHRAMYHYTVRARTYDETLEFAPAAHRLHTHTRQGEHSVQAERAFATQVVDLLSAFYRLRRLPSASPTCTLVYGNRRVYTVWLTAQGLEQIKTVAGVRCGRKFAVRFASEKATQISTGMVWLDRDNDDLPLLAELHGPQPLTLRLHRYDVGQDDLPRGAP